MKKKSLIILGVLAAFFLVANLILLYEHMQAGERYGGSFWGAIGMVFTLVIVYLAYKQQSGKE